MLDILDLVTLMLVGVTAVTMYVAMPEDLWDRPENVLFLGIVPGYMKLDMLLWTERKR